MADAAFLSRRTRRLRPVHLSVQKELSLIFELSPDLSGGVHETEDVVEDVVVAVCGEQLEGLGVAHRSALLLDLGGIALVRRSSTLSFH